MRMILRNWQAYALDRALEHDQDGRLIWRTVIVTVGRQSGKSVLSRALCMWRLHHAELLGGEQTILHVANRRQTAVEVFRPAGLWAQNQYGTRAVKWGNNNTQIELPSGDRWIVQAANENAGVGYSISMAFIDEAWRVQRDTVDDAIWPTMAERDNPQLWLVSTAGDSRSDLMAAYRQQAIDQIDAPRDTLILEWSAPPGADIAEVSTWMWGSPEWNPRRKAFVQGQFEKVEPDAFRRQFLNQWTILANHWLPERHWTETQTANQDLPAGMWHIAVESDFDGSSHAVAVAATDEQGLVHVRVTAHPTLKDVDEQLAKLRAQNPTMHVLVTPGYADRLRTRFDGMVGQREAVVATQVLMDLFNRRLIRHDGASLLREQIFGTTIAKRQHGWVMTSPKGSGGVHAARAVMFAAWDASKAPRPVAVIRSRSRRGA
jgi:phage terminase large subunit-like protein